MASTLSAVSTIQPARTGSTGPTSAGTVPLLTGTTLPPGISPTRPGTMPPASTTPPGVI